MAHSIEVNDLVKTYPGDVRALDGLSFAVEAGTVFGLLGPNGAGKSTAVKILTTLARADSGQARVAGLDVHSDANRVRRRIGVVAQRSGVDREATGRENLRLQGNLYGLRGRELEGRASELLESFGLADAADRIARGYSGGMQRRLDIAMALVHRPEVLFLDEPTTGLDPEVRADMWEEIARLSERAGPDDPADHALPRGGRPAGLAAWRSSTAARWWPRARPEALKGELAGRRDARRAGRRRGERRGSRRRSRRSPGCARYSSTAAAPRAGRTTARARCPIVLAALESHGRRGRLGDGVPPVARRRLPALHGPHVRSADAEGAEVKR